MISFFDPVNHKKIEEQYSRSIKSCPIEAALTETLQMRLCRLSGDKWREKTYGKNFCSLNKLKKEFKN